MLLCIFWDLVVRETRIVTFSTFVTFVVLKKKIALILILPVPKVLPPGGEQPAQGMSATFSSQCSGETTRQDHMFKDWF